MLQSSHRLPAAVALLALGCAPTWAEAPRVPNPVLLGPIDRIGGHRSGASPTLARVDDSVEAFASASTTQSTHGDVVVTQTTTIVERDGTAKWTVALLRATEGKKDVDVRVEGVDAHSCVILTPSWIQMSKIVAVHGVAVRAGGAR